jgi:hypothetical protein
MPLLRHAGAAGLALLLALALVPAALADVDAAAPDAVTIVAPAGPITLGADGTARIVVRNDSAEDGTPKVTIAADDGAAVTPEVDAGVLAPGAAGPVTITVRDHPDLKGQAIVALEGATARAAVAPIAAVAAPAAKVQAQPAEVQLDLVRHCAVPHLWKLRALCGSHDRARVWVAGLERATVRGQDVRGLGSGEGGQSAVAVLRPAAPGQDVDRLDGPPKAYYNAEAFAGATAHGSYKPVLTLDPGAEKPTQVTVAVRARDWVFWAFLALALGALVGWATHEGYEGRRARKDLTRRLLRLRERYFEAEPDAHAGMPPLQDLFDARGTPVPAVPTKAERQAEGALGYVALYGRVASIKTAKDAEQAEPQVAAAEQAVEDWLEVDRAMRRLFAELRQAPDSLRESATDPLIHDTLEQLKGVDVPATAAATATLATALEAHGALIEPYAAVVALFAEHGGGDQLDPAVAYRKRFPVGTAFAARTPGTLRAFAADLDELRAALSRPRLPEAAPPAASGARVGVEMYHLLGPGSLDVAPYRAAPAAAPGTPTAAGLQRAIRRTDGFISAITFVLVVGTYIATLYSGKPWGSLADYLAGFAAGFGGSALAGIAIAPFLRSAIARGPAASAKEG